MFYKTCFYRVAVYVFHFFGRTWLYLKFQLDGCVAATIANRGCCYSASLIFP